MKRERGLISDCTYNSKKRERDEEKGRTRRGDTNKTHTQSTQLGDEDNEFV